MVAGSDTVVHTRASRLIAEALVEGHDSEVIVQRARSMGLSRGLTDVLLAACPCDSHHETSRTMARTDRVLRVDKVSS